jgi:hypothetical protein
VAAGRYARERPIDELALVAVLDGIDHLMTLAADPFLGTQERSGGL